MSNPWNTTDVTDANGAVVISIETLRRARYPGGGDCQHIRVQGDPLEAELECRDCHLRLNPVVWMFEVLVPRWKHFSSLESHARSEMQRLDLRSRVKCHRCGTTLVLRSNRDHDKQWRSTREGRLETALETISALNPAAAGEKAATIAKEALRARGTHEPAPSGSGER